MNFSFVRQVLMMQPRLTSTLASDSQALAVYGLANLPYMVR